MGRNKWAEFIILTNKKTCAYIVKKLFEKTNLYKGEMEDGFEKLFNRCPAYRNSNKRY